MRELLGMDLTSDGRVYGVYNEQHMMVDPEEGAPYGYQGTIDNMVVDVKKKLVRINDFKTTGKSLTDFHDSVEFWRYWLQAAMYKKLVTNFLKGVLTNEWTIEFRFIVFDKYDQLYPFEVTPKTMSLWEKRLTEAKTQAFYHYDTRDYTLPFDYAHSNVKL